MGINNPIPRSLKSECKKAAKILASFVKPNQVFGADQVIPPDVLKRAKGLAIITVIKAGFLFSGRAGSGVIVARLKDGSWSAPSAIGMAGAGAGGLVGLELTDFVFILNSEEAVKSFSEFGTVTLGGNVSVAAGPLGRNAEAAASASMGGVAAVFSYSKTKGLFAGVSVEGSVIIERREANRKFYGDNCTSKMILSGRVRPPPSVDPLFRILESRAFNYRNGNDNDEYFDDDHYYDDIPNSYNSDSDSNYNSKKNGFSGRNSRLNDSHDDYDEYDDYDNYDSNNSNFIKSSSRRANNTAFSRGSRNSNDYEDNNAANYYSNNRGPRGPSSRSRWEDDIYDRGGNSNRYNINDNHNINDLPNTISGTTGSSNRERMRSPQGSVVSPSISGAPKAVALYTFSGEESGDLPFRKGDVITIIKKSESQNDWWTGKVNGKEGIFPANYVELV